MIIQDKIAANSTYEVQLYKEGVFWIAYEQSAYRISQVKKLKPTKKFVKIVQKEVVSVGFPTSALAGVLLHFTIKEQTDTKCILAIDEAIDDEAFEDWKSDIRLYENKKNVDAPLEQIQSTKNQVVEMIQAYPLAERTPLDAMAFIQQIKVFVNEETMA